MEARRLLGNLVSEVRRGRNFIQEVFSKLRNFLKICSFPFSVTSRRLNVATLKAPEKSCLFHIATLAPTSRCHLTPLSGMLRRWIYRSLSRCDVGSQCRDVAVYPLLERHDIGLNVTTLDNKLSGTSRL